MQTMCCVLPGLKNSALIKITFKQLNPHLSWSAESTWWPRENKSTHKECRCRQQLDTDVSGISHSLQNVTLHLFLFIWASKVNINTAMIN